MFTSIMGIFTMFAAESAIQCAQFISKFLLLIVLKLTLKTFARCKETMEGVLLSYFLTKLRSNLPAVICLIWTSLGQSVSKLYSPFTT